VDDDTPIELGLEEVAKKPASSETSSTGDRSGSVSTRPDELDPYSQLAIAGQFKELLGLVEPIVEGLAPSELTIEKIWWLRASVKLGTPEQFLLGAVSEVASSCVERDTSLGRLARESVLELHSAGAVLLASEISRTLGAPGGANGASGLNSSAQAGPIDGVHRSGQPAVGNGINPNGSRSAAKSKVPAILASVVVLLSVGALVLYVRASATDIGELAQAPLPVSQGPGLAPPPLPAAGAPSALDRVLGAIENRSNPIGTSTNHASAPAAATFSAPPSDKGVGAVARSGINWDGPVETQEVRDALAQGDPVQAEVEDDRNARRLFGDPPPRVEPEAREPSDSDGPRKLSRLVEYRVVSRSIVSREPKFTSPRIAWLERGATVFVDLEDGPFMRVRLASGTSGFVLASDLERVDD
jgi:hypothetical protein